MRCVWVLWKFLEEFFYSYLFSRLFLRLGFFCRILQISDVSCVAAN
ncbi:unnamed protein product [Brassica rapa subsp. trilocularis]